MVGSNKSKRKSVGLFQYTKIPFYNLAYDAFSPKGTPKKQRIGKIHTSKFWYMHELTNKKQEKIAKLISIDLFVNEENLDTTIKNLRNNGAKNIKKIQHNLPLLIYCPECDEKGTTNIKLDDRYDTKNHKVRIYYNHKDKSKHYVATYDLNTNSLSPRGKTSTKEPIDIRKFYPNYWIQKFGTKKNGLTMLEFD